MEEIEQATDVEFNIYPLVDGKVPASVTHAQYVLFNKTGTVISKDLTSGVTYSNGKLVISLSETETKDLKGVYTHECLIRDSDGRDSFALRDKQLTFIKTIARIL